MKIINSNIFRVIFYYYYLFQKKIVRGGPPEIVALRMISAFLVLSISGILMIISTLIYRYWGGLILVLFIYLYVDHILFKTVYDTGLFKKIIRKKPKILNSHILSILFVILFTVSSFLVMLGGGYLSKIIENLGIQLIK